LAMLILVVSFGINHLIKQLYSKISTLSVSDAI